MKKIIFIFALMTPFLFSCSFSLKGISKPSIIVIAIESLSSNDVNCSNEADENKGGFDAFCRESVRFTHAFTPSIMSQASMASVLTGLLPFEHQVRHNGVQSLAPDIKTFPELALDRGYKTSFINSGFSIKRGSRLHQGFESYDDSFQFSLNNFVLPAEQVFTKALAWIKKEAYLNSILQVLVVSDLTTPWISTQNNLGESRSLGFSSQLEEVDESLGYFVKTLKERKLWDNSYVVLMGLNGRPDLNRKNEVSGTNLFSENTQVSLFIKPPKGREEIPRNWKYDGLVTLADIGKTIFEILGNPIQPIKKWSSISLVPIFDDANSRNIDANRIIPVESGWPQMVSLSGVRMSLRRGHSLLLLDQEPKIYNTLTDRSESVGNKIESWVDLPLFSDVRGQLQELNINLWKPIDPKITEDIDFIYHSRSKELFLEEGFYAQLIDRIVKYPDSIVLKNLASDLIVLRKDWRRLEEMNLSWKSLRIADFLAAAYNQYDEIDDIDCWANLFNRSKAFSKKIIPSRRICPDPTFVEFLTLQRKGFAADGDAFQKFIDAYRYAKMVRNFQLFDMSTGGLINGNFYVKEESSLVDMALSMPQFKKVYDLTNSSAPGAFLEFE